MLAAELFGFLAHDALHLLCRLVRGVEIGVIGKPYIHVSPILDVIRHDRSLEPRHKEHAQREKRQRSSETFPAMLDCAFCDPRVPAGEAGGPPYFDRLLRLPA